MAKQVSADIEEEKRAEVGFIHLSPLAWLGVAAAAITLCAGIVLAWRKISSDAKALLADAEARKLVAEAEMAMVKEEGEKRRVAETELERINTELATLEAEYERTKDPKLLEQIEALKSKRDALITQATRPVPTIPAMAPSPVVKPPEKVSLLEKWTGIEPGMIGGAIVIMFLVMAAPRIAETVKIVTKKD